VVPDLLNECIAFIFKDATAQEERIEEFSSLTA
jgi:hypothetical protein